MHKGCSHVFSEIYLHANWHCHRDVPMITPEMERFLHPFIEEYCRKIKGVHFQAVDGTGTHIHLAFQMEPMVGLSDFLGQVKGASSHEVNKQFGREALRWQRGYGIVSFAKKHLPGIISYVKNQKQHHQEGTVREVLEEHGEWEASEATE